MYVDKKLGGVNAVQTLSRLNRTHPEKRGTMVLDFANEAAEIQASFEPYFESTTLSESTDPNLLYEIQGRLLGFPVYTVADVERFAKVYFDKKATQDQLSRGGKLMEILKQKQYQPQSVARQVAGIYLGIKNHLKEIPTSDCAARLYIS